MSDHVLRVPEAPLPSEPEEAADWDPHGEAVTADQRAAYDELRERCPVARDAAGTWTLLRHAEVLAAAEDAATFSSKVSSHLALPNSLDGEEHRAFRALIDRYLTPERVAGQEAQCRAHARALVAALPRGERVKVVTGFGSRFAVRAQSTWLGWPAHLEDELLDWMGDNHAAARSGDRARLADVADRFDALVRGLIRQRRPRLDAGEAPRDVTAELAADTTLGRPLAEAEIVSILRNWTAGDLGSLAASIGVIVYHLADHPGVQDALRAAALAGDDAALEAGIEEILRIDDPFVSNRRVTTCPVTVDEREIPAGARVLLNWTAANRDPRAFGDPDAYAPDANAARNLVFGAGPHVCPGRDLTLMELRCIIGELLVATTRIDHHPEEDAVRETPPVGGWARVPAVLT